MRSGKFIRSIVSGHLYTAIMVIVGFVATPLSLHWLGDERFGAFQVGLDWLGYLALLQLGFGGALMPLLARAAGQNDERAVRSYMVEGIRAYSKVAALMLVAGIALSSVIIWLIPVRPALAADLRWGFLIGALSAVAMPLMPFRWLAESRQNSYVTNILLTGQSLGNTAFSLWLAWAGWGIAGQFISNSAATILFYLALAALTLRSVPGLFGAVLGDPRHPEVVADVRALNWPTFAFDICGRVQLLTDNIIVARLLSPAMVAPFYVTQRLATLAQRELQGVGNASWAALAELNAQGRHEIFNRRIVELTRLVCVLGLATLIPLVAYNHAFVDLWVGSARYGGGLLTIAAAGNALLMALSSLWGWCIGGTGNIRRLMPGMIAQTVINLVCSVAFTLMFGIAGPVLGTTVAMLSVSIWYIPWLMSELFETSPRGLLGSLVSPLLIAIPFAAALAWFEASFGGVTWLATAYQMTSAALLYLALCWLLILNRDERRGWLLRAQQAFRDAVTA